MLVKNNITKHFQRNLTINIPRNLKTVSAILDFFSNITDKPIFSFKPLLDVSWTYRHTNVNFKDLYSNCEDPKIKAPTANPNKHSFTLLIAQALRYNHCFFFRNPFNPKTGRVNLTPEDMKNFFFDINYFHQFFGFSYISLLQKK